MYINSALIMDASQGLGLEIVQELLFVRDRPEHVFVACQCDENTTDLEQLQWIYPELKIFRLGIPVEESYRALREYVESYVGDAGLNLLMNNLKLYEKGQTPKNVRTVSTKITQQNYVMNTTAYLSLIKEMYPLLKKAALNDNCTRVRSAVVNVTSLLDPSQCMARAPGFMAYKASKAALSFITQCAFKELIPQRILVIGLHSGILDFPSSVLKTSDVISDLAEKFVNLIREIKEENFAEGRIYEPSGSCIKLRPISPRAML